MLNIFKKRKIIGYLHADCSRCKFKKCREEDMKVIDGKLSYIGNKQYIRPVYSKGVK